MVEESEYKGRGGMSHDSSVISDGNESGGEGGIVSNNSSHGAVGGWGGGVQFWRDLDGRA